MIISIVLENVCRSVLMFEELVRIEYVVFFYKLILKNDFNRDNLSGTSTETVSILKDLGINYNEDDVLIVKHVCRLVSDRSAILVSICKHIYK